jgi:hypothetical protein
MLTKKCWQHSRKNIGNTQENVDEKILVTLPKNVDEKILATFPKNVR